MVTSHRYILSGITESGNTGPGDIGAKEASIQSILHETSAGNWRKPPPPNLKVVGGDQGAERKVYLVFYCHYRFQGSVDYLCF